MHFSSYIPNCSCFPIQTNKISGRFFFCDIKAWFFIHSVTLNYPDFPTEQDKEGSKDLKECTGKIYGNWYPGTFLLDLGASGGLKKFIGEHIEDNYKVEVDDRRWGSCI